jgi:S1-C subfamily serine protease
MPSYDFRVKRGVTLASGCRRSPFAHSLESLWQTRTEGRPLKIAILLGGLLIAASATGALAQDPKRVLEAWGDCNLRGDHERTIRACTYLISFDDYARNPKRYLFWVTRARAYDAKGEHTKAISDFSQAIQLNPNHAKAYFERGYAYYQLGQHNRSVQDYTESIRLKADEPIFYWQRGEAYDAMGHQEKARADYQKAISLTATTPQGLELQEFVRARLAALENKKTDDGGSSGTGVIVSANGNILTNAHVVRDCRNIEVKKAQSIAASARIVAVDKENDLALLQGDVTPVVLPSFRTARLGESVFAFGFPLTGFLAASGNFTAGNITATAGIRDDARMIQTSAPVQRGNSGGPLLDASGGVVGIVVAKLDALKFANVAKDLTQNINFAIKTSIAVQFLQANNVRVQTMTGAKPLAPADIAERATGFTLHVSCR